MKLISKFKHVQCKSLFSNKRIIILFNLLKNKKIQNRVNLIIAVKFKIYARGFQMKVYDIMTKIFFKLSLGLSICLNPNYPTNRSSNKIWV